MNRIVRMMVLAAGAASAAQGADNLLLSVINNTGNELAGLTFTDGDVVRTNQAGSSASLFLAEGDIFAANTDLDPDDIAAFTDLYLQGCP